MNLAKLHPLDGERFHAAKVLWLPFAKAQNACSVHLAVRVPHVARAALRHDHVALNAMERLQQIAERRRLATACPLAGHRTVALVPRVALRSTACMRATHTIDCAGRQRARLVV
jgi:hypothetical protein